MSKLTYKASYYALYAMFAIILIVMGIFFFGGDATGDAVIPGVDPEMWQPAQTDALLYLMYALFFLRLQIHFINLYHLVIYFFLGTDIIFFLILRFI